MEGMMRMAERVAIIPARGGSVRIPRKNIRPLGGRPIICWSIENAQRVCDRVIVSTEDAEIAQIARDMGAEVHQRSFEMARNEVGTQEVAKNVLDELRIRRTARVLVLYPCAPLVRAEDLRLAIMRPHYVVAVGAEPLADAGAFYAGRCSDFRDGVPLWKDNTSVIVYPPHRVCDVNTEEDWADLERKYAALQDGAFYAPRLEVTQTGSIKWINTGLPYPAPCVTPPQEAA